MIESIEVGATVLATDGEVGTVEEVVRDPAGGGPTALVVRRADGRRVAVPVALVDAASTAREVRVTVARDALVEGGTAFSGEGRGLEAVGDRLVVPVREEVLVPTTHQVELGAVRVHRLVEEIPIETTVDVMRDQVTVERVPLGHQIDAVPAPRHEGETLIVPVVEEVLVTEKRLVLREEIRITRRQVGEAVPIRETVRREVVEIEDPSGARARVGPPAAAGGSVGPTTTSSRPAGDAADDLPLS